MSEPLFHPGARIDHAVARRWYADRSGRAADQYPLIDDMHRYFLLKRFPHYLVFRTDSEGVLVIAVAHAKRAADYWADRG